MGTKEELHVNPTKREISRRQFLNYTLMGVGGFMGAALLTPMLRLAIDPVTNVSASSDMVSTGLKVEDITKEPTRVDFKVKQVDGWYETEETRTAWVYKENDNIVALSPTCKHLGCTVSWNGSKDHPNEFFCPCHGGRYKKNGKNVPKTPPTTALDTFQQGEKDGILMLGQKRPNKV